MNAAFEACSSKSTPHYILPSGQMMSFLPGYAQGNSPVSKLVMSPNQPKPEYADLGTSAKIRRPSAPATSDHCWFRPVSRHVLESAYGFASGHSIPRLLMSSLTHRPCNTNALRIYMSWILTHNTRDHFILARLFGSIFWQGIC